MTSASALPARPFCATCEGWRSVAVACDVIAPRGNYVYGPCPDCTDGYAPLTDNTIRDWGNVRHLVVNGTPVVGWLVACGMRYYGPTETLPTLNVSCDSCLSAMDAHDY